MLTYCPYWMHSVTQMATVRPHAWALFQALGDVCPVCRYVGLWRAEVMESEVVGRRPASFTADLGERQRRRGALQPTLELLVGDSSGARAHISVPYDRRQALPTTLIAGQR